MNDQTIILDEVGLGLYGAVIKDRSVNSFSARPSKLLNAGKEYTVTLKAGDVDNNDPLNGIMDACLNHLDGDADTNEEGNHGGEHFLETTPPSSKPTFLNLP